MNLSSILKGQGIQISMDGRGCWWDKVFVDRFLPSLKYEEVYSHAYATVGATREGMARYMTFYNQLRPHRGLDGRTPDRVYCHNLPACTAHRRVGLIRQALLMNSQKLSKQPEHLSGITQETDF